jgi:hypothetical protein
MIVQPDATYLDKYISDGISNDLGFDNLADQIKIRLEYSDFPTADIIFNVQSFFINEYQTLIVGGSKFSKYDGTLFKVKDYTEYWNDSAVELEYFKYKYQPKRLSFDLYGTIFLWQGLMLINYATRFSEFIGPRFVVFDPNKIVDFIVDVLTLRKNLYKKSIF